MTSVPAGTALSDARVLEVWEAGRSRSLVERAELLYRATEARDSPSSQPFDGLTIGTLDGRLMDCRAATFGPVVEAAATCPACREELVFQLDLREVRAPVTPVGGPVMSSTDGRHRVVFRLPTLADLRVAAEANSVEDARETLYRRCVRDAWQGDTRVGVESLPVEVLAEVSRSMAEHDPQADVRLSMTCPACQQAWESRFDIGAFLWQEIDARSRRLLTEVHALASSYGWREPEILAMPPARRQAYLELVLG